MTPADAAAGMRWLMALIAAAGLGWLVSVVLQRGAGTRARGTTVGVEK
jgi:hypothetical protein